MEVRKAERKVPLQGAKSRYAGEGGGEAERDVQRGRAHAGGREGGRRAGSGNGCGCADDAVEAGGRQGAGTTWGEEGKGEGKHNLESCDQWPARPQRRVGQL